MQQRPDPQDQLAAVAGFLREQALLPPPRGGNLPELNRLLCERIAGGTIGVDTPGLRQHLWQTTLDQLAVDQPGYDSYRREACA